MASTIFQGLQQEPLKIIPYEGPPHKAAKRPSRALSDNYRRSETTPFNNEAQSLCGGIDPDTERRRSIPEDSRYSLEDFDLDFGLDPIPPCTPSLTPQLDCVDPLSRTVSPQKEPQQQSTAGSSVSSSIGLAPGRGRAFSASISRSLSPVSAPVHLARENHEEEDKSAQFMSYVQPDKAPPSETSAAVGSKRRHESPKPLLRGTSHQRKYTLRRSGSHSRPPSTKGSSSAVSLYSSLFSDGEEDYKPGSCSDMDTVIESDSDSDEEEDEDEDEDEDKAKDTDDDVLVRKKRFGLSSRSRKCRPNHRGSSVDIGVAQPKRAATRSKPTWNGSGALISPPRSSFESVTGPAPTSIHPLTSRMGRSPHSRQGSVTLHAAPTNTSSRPPAAPILIVPHRATPTRTCTICFEQKPLYQYSDEPPTRQCTHEVFNICSAYTEAHIQTRLAFNLASISCLECGNEMTYNNLYRVTLTKLFRRYNDKLAKASYDSIPSFTYCLQPGCGFI